MKKKTKIISAIVAGWFILVFNSCMMTNSPVASSSDIGLPMIEIPQFDFQYNNIFYRIISDTTVEVVASVENPKLQFNYHKITNILIPSSITYNETTYKVIRVGDYAFYHCNKLTSITLPEGIESIGSMAFCECRKLGSITIPNSVTKIEFRAFWGCSSLKEISIPKSVIEIGGESFEETPWYQSLQDTMVYINDMLYKYRGSNRLNTPIKVKFKPNTKSISDFAFAGYKSLDSIAIPESVSKLGVAAFWHANIRWVDIPDAVECIPFKCFAITWLASVTIPKNVKSIGERAFAYCLFLKSVTLPASLTEIGNFAFLGCENLVELRYEGSMTQWNNIKKCQFWNRYVPATVVYCIDGEIQL